MFDQEGGSAAQGREAGAASFEEDGDGGGNPTTASGAFESDIEPVVFDNPLEDKQVQKRPTGSTSEQWELDKQKVAAANATDAEAVRQKPVGPIAVGGGLLAVVVVVVVLMFSGAFDNYVECASMTHVDGTSTLGAAYDTQDCVEVVPGGSCSVKCASGYESSGSRTKATFVCPESNEDPDAQPVGVLHGCIAIVDPCSPSPCPATQICAPATNVPSCDRGASCPYEDPSHPVLHDQCYQAAGVATGTTLAQCPSSPTVETDCTAEAGCIYYDGSYSCSAGDSGR